jgi:hypothetical protein
MIQYQTHFDFIHDNIVENHGSVAYYSQLLALFDFHLIPKYHSNKGRWGYDHHTMIKIALIGIIERLNTYPAHRRFLIDRPRFRYLFPGFFRCFRRPYYISVVEQALTVISPKTGGKVESVRLFASSSSPAKTNTVRINKTNNIRILFISIPLILLLAHDIIIRFII